MNINKLEKGMKVLTGNPFNVVYTIEKVNKSTLWLKTTTGEKRMRGGRLEPEYFLYKGVKPSIIKRIVEG